MLCVCLQVVFLLFGVLFLWGFGGFVCFLFVITGEQLIFWPGRVRERLLVLFPSGDKKMCGKLISHVRIYLVAFHHCSSALCAYHHLSIFTFCLAKDDDFWAAKTHTLPLANETSMSKLEQLSLLLWVVLLGAVWWSWCRVWGDSWDLCLGAVSSVAFNPFLSYFLGASSVKSLPAAGSFWLCKYLKNSDPCSWLREEMCYSGPCEPSSPACHGPQLLLCSQLSTLQLSLAPCAVWRGLLPANREEQHRTLPAAE